MNNFKTLSVHGGAGGQGIRISFSRPFAESHYGSPWKFSSARGPTIHSSDNEKVIMQNLNGRLASFIQKVNSLQQNNAELERKIRERCASHTPPSREYSEYLNNIESLHDQIQQIYKSNGEIELKIQNACLAADDFKKMYELEMALRRSAETDTAYCRKVRDEITIAHLNLENECESLSEERILLIKHHEDEKAQICAEAESQVEVTVDAAPSADLNQALTNIREQYGAAVSKNHRDLEAWFQKKVSTVEKNVIEQTEDLENTTTKLRQLKSNFHTMQIEMQTQHNMIMSHKGSLQDTVAQYSEQLAELQKIITDLEFQIKQFHANKAQNKQDYDNLLEVKTNLEAEIKQYKLLLEGENSDPQAARRKITVLKLVESSETIMSRKGSLQDTVAQYSEQLAEL